MKKELKVTTRWDPLNVRTGPGMQYRVKKTIPKGSTVMANEEKGGWYKHNKGGWSCGRYLTLIKDYDPPKTNNITQDSNGSKPSENGDKDKTYELSEDEILGLTDFAQMKPTDPFDEMRVVHVLPFQFLPTADVRPDNCAYGRTFLETMISDGSFLFVTPGKPAFFTKITEGDKKSFLKAAVGGDESSLSDIVNNMDGRYYTFEGDYTNYQSYVRAMCRVAAYNLKINDRDAFGTDPSGKGKGKKYGDMDWTVKKGGDFAGNFVNNPVFKEMSNSLCCAIYIDGAATSYSESLSNTAEPSMITGLLNKASDATREVKFLFGGMGKMPDQDLVEGSMKNVESVINQLTSSMNRSVFGAGIEQFTDMGKAVIYGGNILVPDIWKDSAFNRNYNIEVKLASPYGDPESIYLHILVPLFHIMAFCFPRQLGRSGYTAPFLVRAFCKGWFNCDMGIVESFQVKKASQDGWSTDGLPTEIDVSFSIKDLYSVIGIASSDHYSYLKNTEFMDMIGTLCGININKPSIQRKLALIQGFLGNKIGDTFQNMIQGIQESAWNKINNLLT
ncbi:SH3 domain-containing protein [Arthrospira platensis SPKY2]